MDSNEHTQRTFLLERIRAVASGVLETAGTTFLLLIAVQGFAAGPTPKALIAGGGSLGLVLTPVMVYLAARTQIRAARMAALTAALGAIAFGIVAALPALPVFVVGSVLGLAAASAVIPLLTHIYQDNYPESRRGRLFAQTVMIRIAAAAVFSEVAGRALSWEGDWGRRLLVVFALAHAVAAICLSRCPSRPVALSAGEGHPFRSLRLVAEDPLFRHTLVCWMLMGFANLMMLPLRVEYLANPRHGLGLSAGEVAFLVGVVPNAARLVMSPVWGWLFDRVNFFSLRATLNVGFAVGILAFFTSDDLTGLLLGSVVYGISNAGGDVAWGLWVTKFAPPGRVADYMSVHTFLTGVRGLAAPLAAFQLAAWLPLWAVGAVAAAMILLSAVMLVREIRSRAAGRSVPALVEEVSE